MSKKIQNRYKISFLQKRFYKNYEINFKNMSEHHLTLRMISNSGAFTPAACTPCQAGSFTATTGLSVTIHLNF